MNDQFILSEGRNFASPFVCRSRCLTIGHLMCSQYFRFEAALQEIDDRVTLPFFDSRLDYNLYDPRESNFWGENFMGDHRGVVSNGPFRLWRQRNGAYLERNGGNSGSMISPRGIRDVLSRRRNIDILSPWAARGRYGLENYHNAYV